jgi:hypothetical protein
LFPRKHGKKELRLTLNHDGLRTGQLLFFVLLIPLRNVS